MPRLHAATRANLTPAGGVASYDVTAGGLIAYSPAVDVFADGQGTMTLTLVGHQVIVDATQKPATTRWSRDAGPTR